MAIRTDYHLHTHHSGDCNAPLEDVIRSAIEKGLSAICFTEHMDLHFPETEETHSDTFTLDGEAYRREFQSLYNKYGDRIDLRFGLECGMQTANHAENSAFIHRYGFDVVLGSVHLLYGEDPYPCSFFKDHPERSEKQAFADYLASTLQMIREFDDFDVLAHMDYLIRYCPGLDRRYDFSEHEPVITAILEELVKRDKALEINTAGIRRGMEQANPAFPVIAKYHELGGRLVSVGSDAHRPEDLAANFEKAEAFLRKAGFTEYTVYQKRKPVFLPL